MLACNKASNRRRHRGAAAVFAAISMVTIMGMAALAIDVGMLYTARGELQASADSAAMAGAWVLLNENRLKSEAELQQVFSESREAAARYASFNKICNSSPLVDLNSGNGPDGDVVLGYLSDPTNLDQPMSFDIPMQYNAVRVHVRRNHMRNGPIELVFARFFGFDSAELGAEATAAFADGVSGYRVTDETGNAELMPLALHINSWLGLLDGSAAIGDNYTYDPDTGTVTAGADGLPELNLYPGAGETQLPPGNFGTVDIGSPNNSTADISRQIRYGVSAEDLAYFGGELSVPVDLNGDTGLSAGIKDDLEFIKGRPRAIPLFSQVSGPGNNANYSCVAFAGIRIMNVKLTGPMNKKTVIVQPAFVVDDAAFRKAGWTPSYFVFEPVRIVR